jgi:hypothetical protein
VGCRETRYTDEGGDAGGGEIYIKSWEMVAGLEVDVGVEMEMAAVGLGADLKETVGRYHHV